MLISEEEQVRLQALGAKRCEEWSSDWPAGDLRVLGQFAPPPRLAIVGTRKADPYGLEIAQRIAENAAERETAVVSGGAFGIDCAAHEGALRAGGRTMVVLGSGLDHPSPLEHWGLYQRILKANGALLSPFSCDMVARKWSFPQRNQWIAAISQGVIVVQASLQSGALQTARAALKLKRKVWVVPGPFDHPLHQGCHALVNEGAQLLTSADSWSLPGAQLELFDLKKKNAVIGEPDVGGAIWRVTSSDAKTFAELAMAAQLSLPEAAAYLFSLEQEGWVRCVSGNRYVRSCPEFALKKSA